MHQLQRLMDRLAALVVVLVTVALAVQRQAVKALQAVTDREQLFVLAAVAALALLVLTAVVLVALLLKAELDYPLIHLGA